MVAMIILWHEWNFIKSKQRPLINIYCVTNILYNKLLSILEIMRSLSEQNKDGDMKMVTWKMGSRSDKFPLAL